MKTIDLNSWHQFDEYIRTECKTSDRASDFLFRGHADASWPLKTTLERFVKREMSVADYYRVIYRAQPEIQTFTNEQWNLLIPPDYERWVNGLDVFPWGDVSPGEYHAYEYMIYLRHHGFPSPMLDWTHSPYIAAFFAFGTPSSTSEGVCIYIFQELPAGSKAFSKGSPRIAALGPYATSHSRHFRQQCRYTMSTTWKENSWYFTEHDQVFNQGKDNQDVLVKLILPTSIRSTVLRHLDQYNLNSFSLFGSEESLMHTMAARVFDL